MRELTRDEKIRIRAIARYSNYGMDRENRISLEDAIFIWHLVHDLSYEDKELYKLFFMFNQLSRELTKGKRCGVCGRYDNPSCSTEC